MENFNRTLKRYFHKKSNIIIINIINFVDILADEVMNHEKFLIEENRRPLELISQNKLKIKNEENFYESIMKF